MQEKRRTEVIGNATGQVKERVKSIVSRAGLRNVILFALVVFVLLNSIVIVGSGKSGVVVTLGAVRDEILTEGIHFKIPFVQKVIEIDNRTKKIQVDASAASKDLQTVTCEVAVNYKVINSFSSSIYKNVGRVL